MRRGTDDWLNQEDYRSYGAFEKAVARRQPSGPTFAQYRSLSNWFQHNEIRPPDFPTFAAGIEEIEEQVAQLPSEVVKQEEMVPPAVRIPKQQIVAFRRVEEAARRAPMPTPPSRQRRRRASRAAKVEHRRVLRARRGEVFEVKRDASGHIISIRVVRRSRTNRRR